MSGRSWFYLTLWHGTPPGMTEFVDAELNAAERPGVEITTADRTERSIERMAFGSALIEKNSSARADITARTEVVWYVGGVQPGTA